jgi:hypothetical protein
MDFFQKKTKQKNIFFFFFEKMPFGNFIFILLFAKTWSADS